MDKRELVIKVFAGILTVGILILLIMTGPAEAFILGLNILNNDVKKGDIVNMDISVNINNNENLPIENITFKLTGNKSYICDFFPNGTIISGCLGTTIVQISSVEQKPGYGYGYGYGNYQGNNYSFGYGYGFTQGLLRYNITINTTNYDPDVYKSLLSVNIKDKVFEESGRDITIRTGLLTVYSPENNKFYNTENIPFKILTSTKVKKIEYIDWNDKNPTWIKLCEKCTEYGISKEKFKKFPEGMNSISIRATDTKGKRERVDLVFFVDSEKPKIKKIKPEVITNPGQNPICKEICTAPNCTKACCGVNGSEFYIKYTEENLKSITLFCGDLNVTKDSSQCPSGANKECRFDINLSKYNNQQINCWFRIEDNINFEDSEKIRVLVDTISPVIKINNPKAINYNTNKIPFNISVSEEVSLNYFDLNEKEPKWRELCNKCSGYGLKEKKLEYFSKGNHDVLVKAVDKAGNSDIKEVTFKVL